MFRHYFITGYKLIILQLLILSVVAGFSVFKNGWHVFVSVLLGGSAWIIPSLYFVHKLFKSKATRDSLTLLKDFLLGEGVKLLLSVGLITVIIIFVPIETIGFISGYIAAISAAFLMPFVLLKKTKNDK